VLQKKNARSKLAKALAKKEHKKYRPLVFKVKDERKNFDKSTYTAARYLKDRCRNLDNDYLLVVASYNCGVGNVWNAMQKTGKSNPDFWDVKKYLPAETRSYVMNFIALNVIFNNYEKFTSNTLCFKPITVKAENMQENMTEETEEPSANNK
jgi:soluble lytic murein transglycosylase-like protein